MNCKEEIATQIINNNNEGFYFFSKKRLRCIYVLFYYNSFKLKYKSC